MGLIDMFSKNDGKFFLASYEMMSHVIQFCGSAVHIIEVVSLSDYADKFANLSKSLDIARDKIKEFIDQWKDDDYKVCSTFRTIDEYFKYYCISMRDSTPSNYLANSRYIKDSLTTAKLALQSKLKYLNEHGK